jgi:hypothetical protein
LEKNAMKINFPIEVETNPLAYAGVAGSLDPGGRPLSIYRIRREISVALNCQAN